MEVGLLDENYKRGEANFFRVINDYINVLEKIVGDIDLFISAMDPRATSFDNIFKRQVLRKNSFFQ